MQSLWSRAAPQSTCRCVSCLSTTANGVTSRSGAAASKRRLRIGNSVTALYTSIFAAAALADASVKDQRRHDWDERIAAVKAEVTELVDEEQRILASLQSRRRGWEPNRLPHTRGFGTIVNFPPALERTPSSIRSTRSFHTGRRFLGGTSAQVSESASLEVERELTVEDLEDGDLFVAVSETLPHWVLKDDLRLKAIQKLALRQFAIRLLLRPIIAHRYSGVSMNYAADFDLPQINVEKLLDELNNIRHRIHQLRTYKNSSFSDVIEDYAAMHIGTMQKGRDSLDAELNNDIQLFMSEQMSLQELLLRISSNLLNSVDPDRTAAFRYILMAFTKTRQNDLNDLLLQTLLPHRFYLSSSLIITILAFLRKSKNLKHFDLFLKMLSGEGYSVNLGSLGHYRQRRINGLEMVVPPIDSSNPVIYATLISSALRFNQPDRADAWLQAARSVGFFDDFTTLFAYLRFYSIRQDWEKGAFALKRALTFLVSSTELPVTSVERLLARMVHLCDSCGRADASEALISAAMESGFDSTIPSRQVDIVPIVNHGTKRWTKAAGTAPAENINRPLWQKCFEFAGTFGEQLSQLETIQVDSFARRHAKLAGRHAQNAMSATFAQNLAQPEQVIADRSSLSRPSSSQGGSPHKGTTQAQGSQSEELTALKDEVAQLRELVFELRKHHIEDSFKDDDSSHGEREESISQPTNPPSTTDSFKSHQSSMSVEFEQISNLVDSDKFHTPPSDTQTPRPRTSRRKQHADLMTMVPPVPLTGLEPSAAPDLPPSPSVSESIAQTEPLARGSARGSRGKAETARPVLFRRIMR